MLVILGEAGSSRLRSSMTGGRSIDTQRNRGSGIAASSRQKLVWKPSASATTVASGWVRR